MDNRANNVNNRNNRNNINNNAVNFAIELHNRLLNHQFNQNITIRPLIVRQNDINSRYVVIDIVHQNSPHVGQIIMYMPNEGNGGYVHMLCCINAHNGYFIDTTFNTFEQMIDVINFTENILPYQPDVHFLDYVRVPNHLIDYWCVPAYLRDINLNPQEIN